MLPLSVHLVAWPSTRPGLAAAARLGFPAVEVFALGLWNNPPGDIAARLAEHDLELSAVFLDLPADPAAAASAAARAAADAASFGATRLIVTAADPHRDADRNGGGAVAGQASPAGDATLLAVRRSAVIAAVAAAGQAAAHHGVRLCLHPHQGTAVESAADTDAVLAATDPAQVWVCADTGHLLAAGDNPAAAIAGWAPRLAAVHLKDIGAAGSVVPVGTGRLDVAGTLAALEGAVAAGAPLDHLTIEVEGFADPDAALRRSARAVTGVAA